MNAFVNIIKHIFKRIRRFKINREFLIFVVFLIVSIVFWFLQTFKETTNATLTYKLNITGVPNNVILTSTVPKEITATVSGRGFSILEYLSQNERQELNVDYSSLQNENGLLTIDNQTWRNCSVLCFRALCVSSRSILHCLKSIIPRARTNMCLLSMLAKPK